MSLENFIIFALSQIEALPHIHKLCNSEFPQLGCVSQYHRELVKNTDTINPHYSWILYLQIHILTKMYS